MRNRYFRLLSLILLLALAGEASARGYTEGKPLRFDLYRGYLIVARGAAGPLKDLNFVLDTGASPTVVDRRLMQKLHLAETPGVLAGINGRVQTGLTTMPDLEFGAVRKDGFPVLVEDLSFFDKVLPVRIDAVIGLDVLGQTPFEIDYGSGQIVFGSVPALRNSLPLEVRAGLPMVTAEVNHVSARLLLDTGGSSLILFGKSPVSVSPVSAVEHSSNMIGEFERKQVTLNSLRLGQTEFRQQPAFLVQSRGDGTADFDGLMSPALLGMTRLVIDLGRGVVEFSR